MRFFESFLGMYMIQSVAHSVVTLLIVEMSLRIWGVEDARERFRYRVIVIVLPFFMFPVFQLLNPERGTFYFIEDRAIFSAVRWLRLEIFGLLPLWGVYLAATGGISAIALIQEIGPIARDIFSKSRGGEEELPDVVESPGVDELVGEMSGQLGIEKPGLRVVDDETPIIYTAGTKNHEIIASRGLLDLLDARQLKSAMAHELAHIVRRSSSTTLMVFLVRICMFYNPVSLLEFRRLVQDDELICDDITVSVTGDPQALAETLKVFRIDIEGEGARGAGGVRDAIEGSSHNLLLGERIARLENHHRFGYHSPGWGRFAMTCAAVLGINYFVV